MITNPFTRGSTVGYSALDSNEHMQVDLSGNVIPPNENDQGEGPSSSTASGGILLEALASGIGTRPSCTNGTRNPHVQQFYA